MAYKGALMVDTRDAPFAKNDWEVVREDRAAPPSWCTPEKADGDDLARVKEALAPAVTPSRSKPR